MNLVKKKHCQISDASCLIIIRYSDYLLNTREVSVNVLNLFINIYTFLVREQ